MSKTTPATGLYRIRPAGAIHMTIYSGQQCPKAGIQCFRIWMRVQGALGTRLRGYDGRGAALFSVRWPVSGFLGPIIEQVAELFREVKHEVNV